MERLNSGSFGFEEAQKIRTKLRGREGTKHNKTGLGGKYSRELTTTVSPDKPPRGMKSADSTNSIVSADGWGNDSFDASMDADESGFGTSPPRAAAAGGSASRRMQRNLSTNSVTSTDGFDEDEDDDGYLQISAQRKLSTIVASPQGSTGDNDDDDEFFAPDAFGSSLASSPSRTHGFGMLDLDTSRLGTRNASVCEGFDGPDAAEMSEGLAALRLKAGGGLGQEGRTRLSSFGST
jgi:hypothetical protein